MNFLYIKVTYCELAEQATSKWIIVTRKLDWTQYLIQLIFEDIEDTGTQGHMKLALMFMYSQMSLKAGSSSFIR
jgi:hypothetical protein